MVVFVTVVCACVRVVVAAPPEDLGLGLVFSFWRPFDKRPRNNTCGAPRAPPSRSAGPCVSDGVQRWGRRGRLRGCGSLRFAIAAGKAARLGGVFRTPAAQPVRFRFSSTNTSRDLRQIQTYTLFFRLAAS